MAAVTICSDFGAQRDKVSHCFYYFLIYLPRSDGTRCHDLSFLNVAQGTLKSFLQHHSSKVSILWCSAFFMVWLSHLYMTPGIGENIVDLGYGGVLNITLNTWFIKEIIDTLDYIKINFCLWKTISREWEGKPLNERKYLKEKCLTKDYYQEYTMSS